MEDETKLAEGPEGTEPATTGTEPAAEGAGDGAGEPDYKALYERAVADSRKWERRSKANLAAARGAKKSVEDEVAELKAQLRRMEDERAHAELVSGVASAKGVPRRAPPRRRRGRAERERRRAPRVREVHGAWHAARQGRGARGRGQGDR